MFKFRTIPTVAAAASAVLSLGVAHAAVIPVANVVASSAFGGFEANYAIDNPSAMTDWATNGQQSGGYLQIDLGSVQALGVVLVTDRVTSGAAQGVFGGQTNDFTTSYTLQAYTDGTFTTALGPAVTETQTAPAQPTTLASFETSADLTGVTAEFVQYTINASMGNNPGLEDITFDTPSSVVPEPASILTLSLGVGLLWTMRRRGRSA